MAYDIAYEGDDHEHLQHFMEALLNTSQGAWAVRVTHAVGEHTGTGDYALIAMSPAGNAVLRSWPTDEVHTDLPEDTGTDIEVSADQITELKVY